MIIFVSNRLTNPFMFDITLNSYLSFMLRHTFHNDVGIRKILYIIVIMCTVCLHMKKQNVHEIHKIIPLEKCVEHCHYV